MSEEGGLGPRSRRRTAKVVNYSKEQDFSDDDVFEDDDEKEDIRVTATRTTSTKKRGRPRKSVDPSGEPEPDEEDFGPTKPLFTEKGYDPTLPPIRERFTFLPEVEADGSPRIELIVGRRPMGLGVKNGTVEDVEQDEDDGEGGGTRKRRSTKMKASPQKKKDATGEITEYEYLIKYKGVSYLHLDWKTGGDLESMNRSAKNLYRRFLKKLAHGIEEDIENPEIDPSYVLPQKIVDEADQEVSVELTDQELVNWEKENNDEEDSDEDDVKFEKMDDEELTGVTENGTDIKNSGNGEDDDLDVIDFDDDIDFVTIPMDKLRVLAKRVEPYYPVIEGSDNPYRDGYVTEPPKKSRASYLFFQCTMRSYFLRRNENVSQAELMSILGEAWRNMSEAEQAPFVQLAKEEAEQYEKEKLLLEKAQKPNEVWQPMRRCLQVLDAMVSDGFSNIFLEPVDLKDFPDYEDIVDTPMDLGTVRKKLAGKKYAAPENFARDVRKIWNNCKVYNQHGSAIWFVADYMAKKFERLFQAWVLGFRDRYLRWAHAKARPWEHSCRMHDGKCRTRDAKMIMCDHCDASYGIECMKLNTVPDGAWHCPECKPRLKKVKEISLMSAVSEAAARKKAELGDVPKKKVHRTMYLVKWAGLGYEFCTWETREDVNDDALIDEYQRLNKMTPDEPELAEEAVNEVLKNVKHISATNAGGTACIPDLRAQLYAQSRALHFSKFGRDLPIPLSAEVGPFTKSTYLVDAANNEGHESETSSFSNEVVECIAELVHRVVRADSQPLMNVNASLPPLLTGEYDAIIPITSKGLMMNVGEIHGSVAFLGYRIFPDGSKGPAEIANLIRNVGDKIIAVDGVSTVNKSFKDVILLLRDSGKNKFAFMRFLENRFSVCSNDLTSVGNMGRYTVEELHRKFTTDRQRMLVQRKQNLIIEDEVKVEKAPKDEDDESVRSHNTEEESEEDGSEGEFEPDSEDDEVVRNLSNDMPGKVPEQTITIPIGQATQSGDATIQTVTGDAPASVSPTVGNEILSKPEEEAILLKQEATRSLAYRLLDMDVGYSSDEGGEEDCAYFLDGVDLTFSTKKDFENKLECEKNPPIEKALDIPGKKGRSKAQKEEDDESKEEKVMLPVKRNEFNNLGDRAKLVASVAVTMLEPDAEDFVNFPGLSDRDLEAAKAIAAEEAAKLAEAAAAEANRGQEDGSPNKSTKRSTVKVEQISATTGEILRIWANAETAAGTLQVPLDEIRRMLRGEVEEDFGDDVGGFRWQYALSGAEVTKLETSNGRGSKKGKEAYLEFRDKLYDPAEPHFYKNGNRLRDYQIDGVNWLASTWYKQHSCILADEMGLGKTVQIVSYIEHLYRVEKLHRPYLVVVPLSTVEHWRREFQGWTDMVCCVYHDRQRVWRDVMREYEWYFDDRPHTYDYLKFDVLVTTYDTLIGDFDIIGQIPWRVAVVDEAHRLRNQKGKLLECMKEISARGTLQYGFQSRILMTGTPLQNNTQELWTLLNFIEPYKFPSLEDFQANFGNMANRQQVESLQQMISPYMLRRVKEDVAKDIPAKEETVIDVELTSIQKQYYRAIFEQNHAFLSMGSNRSVAPKLMNIQMELRKCCNHPFLLEGIEHRENEKAFSTLLETGALDGKSAEEQQQLLNEHGYIKTSGKMVLLDKLLPKLRSEGHKVLVFSQMVKMLDLISEYCDFRGFRHERLDGRIRGSERQKAIDRFETESDSFMFLLSTRAGGVGINLTAADTCIIFDSDWNPQNDVQAQARCHRIGQTKDVRIYRLITSRSFETEMFDRASKKLGLEQAVLGTFGADNEDDKPTSKEMEQLLKKGAYALLEDDDDVINEFVADDIDSILAKRTRTRVVEGAKTATWLNKQGMMVTKSKFAAEGGGAGVNVDDPDFWQKVMPDFVTPEIMLSKLDELSEAIEGATKKGPGRGRGRGRKKKEEGEEKKDTEEQIEKSTIQVEKAVTSTSRGGHDEDDSLLACAKDDPEENEEDDEEDDDDKKRNQPLSRTNTRKVHKFMSDLKSMMDGIIEEADDDSLPNSEKAVCQKLLLTISAKELIFSEEERHLARVLLKRLEGDKRRRCRTSTEGGSRISAIRTSQDVEDIPGRIPDDLLILSKQQRRKRRKDAGIKRGKRKTIEGEVDEDGYLRHTDSENDWSDVGEDIYKGKHSAISIKEARRRRAWAADDDATTAAGRPWPAFPRHHVSKVLETVLDEMIEYDQAKGGMFSEPVPRDQYPEYYEQIKKPMDYGTMKEKLKNGEYRSVQAAQKDFVLIMQNCLKFNAPSSDVVKEARQQALMKPAVLRKAAEKHKLFMAEDGSVLDIIEEPEEETNEDGSKKKRRRKKKGDEDDEVDSTKPAKKKKSKVKEDNTETEKEEGNKMGDNDEEIAISSFKKPRIRIKMPEVDTQPTKKRKKKATEEEQVTVGENTPLPKSKRRRVEKMPGNEEESNTKKKKKTKEIDDDKEGPIKSNLNDAKLTSLKDSIDTHVDSEEPKSDDPYLNPEAMKKERQSISKGFKAAKKFFCKRGPWTLPSEIGDSRFPDVAMITLSKMAKYDKFDVFTEAVTEDEAPGYYDIIKKPMDFSKMNTKIERGSYGSGSKATAALYEDFLLVFENCSFYNDDDGEVVEEAARLFALLPETYALACCTVAGKRKNIKSLKM